MDKCDQVRVLHWSLSSSVIIDEKKKASAWRRTWHIELENRRLLPISGRDCSRWRLWCARSIICCWFLFHFWVTSIWPQFGHNQRSTTSEADHDLVEAVLLVKWRHWLCRLFDVLLPNLQLRLNEERRSFPGRWIPIIDYLILIIFYRSDVLN